jgi:polyhydroxyalkanoate synthesis regulator phasin
MLRLMSIKELAMEELDPARLLGVLKNAAAAQTDMISAFERLVQTIAALSERVAALERQVLDLKGS